MYTLPLNPMDLTKIYNEKEEVVEVDLESSLKNLDESQLLVYISNTQFEVIFNDITPELLYIFLTTKFKVKCPQLSRVLKVLLDLVEGVDILKSEYEEPELVVALGIDFFKSFNEKNKDLINQINIFIKQLPTYIIREAKNFVEEEIKEIIEVLNLPKKEDKSEDIIFNINVIYSLPLIIDYYLNIISGEGYYLKDNVVEYVNIMNDEKKYQGVDLLGVLNSFGYINLTMGLLIEE